jgi:hypothetical protein
MHGVFPSLFGAEMANYSNLIPPNARDPEITVEQTTTLRKERQAESIVVLRSGEAHWDPEFSDIIRIGVLLCWYVATVNAIKLRNNIFLATRTILDISLFTLCVQTSFVIPSATSSSVVP